MHNVSNLSVPWINLGVYNKLTIISIIKTKRQKKRENVLSREIEYWLSHSV